MIAFLVLETLMIGVFCALDLVLFYVFFEGGLIPMFLIIGIWGGKNRVYATFKFFLYTLLGSVLMLLAMMAMYWHTGTTDIPTLDDAKFPADMQWWLVVRLLRLVRGEAADVAGAHLVAGRARGGADGGLGHPGGDPLEDGRLRLPALLGADVPAWRARGWQPFMFVLSVVAIIYTSLVALAQTDMKKLIAYSSVAHMGFVTMGIFTFTTQGVEGAIFQMVSHGIVSAGLFLCVGVLYDRMHTHEISVVRRPREPHADLRRVLHGLHDGQRGPAGHLRLHRRVPDAAGRLQGQHLGRALCDHGRDLVGGLCALALPPRHLRRSSSSPRSRPSRI